MDMTIDFVTGLSQGVAWPWPIAVYLFLAGISGGAVAIACGLNLFAKTDYDSPQMKAATLVGFLTICLGMVCLVLDLTDPFNFWRILIFYNPTSVMSIGVAALLLYIPLLFVWLLYIFKDLSILRPFYGLLNALKCFQGLFIWLLLILSVAICAYTGFLISALIRFPLINTAVLPALFVASGFSAGCASIQLFAPCFGTDSDDHVTHILHKVEYPVMAIEALCLFMIIVSLISGNAASKAAFVAFTSGVWAQVFWIGAVFVGFVIPLVASFMKNKAVLVSGTVATIAGMMCLRLFILYAGQLNGM